MADDQGSVDVSRLLKLFDQLGDRAQAALDEANQETGAAIAREARARLQRQLGPNATGRTVRGIHVERARDQSGATLVLAYDADEPNDHGPVDLWLEGGVKRGKPHSHASAARPFFHASVALEQGPHLRRVAEAMQAAIDELGGR